MRNSLGLMFFCAGLAVVGVIGAAMALSFMVSSATTSELAMLDRTAKLRVQVERVQVKAQEVLRARTDNELRVAQFDLKMLADRLKAVEKNLPGQPGLLEGFLLDAHETEARLDAKNSIRDRLRLLARSITNLANAETPVDREFYASTVQAHTRGNLVYDLSELAAWRSDALAGSVQVVQAAQILSVVLVSALLSTVWLTLIAPLQRRQMQDAADLEASEKEARNLALVAEHTSDGVSIISRTGRIEWLNAAFARHSGFAADDLVGRDFRDILGRRDANPKHIDDLDHAWDKGRTFRGELENRRSDEAPFWTDFELIPITDSETGVSKFISVERNVTERRIASVRLSEATPTEDYHARHDVLTGLPNRQYLLAHLALSLNAAAENGTRVAVFNIDLDHFRPINDTLGQAAGDFVLKTSAKRMRHVLRNNDFLARVGCDEFVVVAPIGDESEVIARIGARLIENVQQTMYFDGEECKVGASIGIAISDAAGSTPDDLILAADIALYEAKRAGRNGYKMFLEEMGSVHSNRQRLFGELKEAIIKGGLEAYFQPQISLKDERLIGFELLARWSHPRNGILTPDEFIDVASEAGLVADIDATILQQGLDALVVMRARGYDVPRVSINASSQSLRDPAYPDLLMFELDSRNLTPEALAVEVLEETLIAGDSDIASKNIAKLHQAGFCVELDDFGSGYAAMSNLASLDISSIKIDKSLIEPLPQAANEAVVRAIIALCRELDLEVLAEGIETNEQVGILRELGCANAQGYWFGKPMTLQRMEMWLDGRAKTLEGFRTAKSA